MNRPGCAAALLLLAAPAALAQERAATAYAGASNPRHRIQTRPRARHRQALSRGRGRALQDFLSEGDRRNPSRQGRAPVSRARGGIYAAVVFHDENDNGEIDHNALHFPAEPLGFTGGFSGALLGNALLRETEVQVTARQSSDDGDRGGKSPMSHFSILTLASTPRWQKLGRDVWGERERIALMIAAIAVSLAAVSTCPGGAYSVLTREIAVNYLGTHPASATLELEGGVDRALVEQVRRRPGIAEAEARRDVIRARVRVGADERPFLLFVVEDFRDLRLNTFRPESGAWPPPPGTLLLERAAVAMVGASTGQSLLITPPSGVPREIAISGLVHDPGLAPAPQERCGYGYIDRATLGLLGEPPLLHELRILASRTGLDARGLEAVSTQLAAWLGSQGHPVHQIRVPPPGEHPHQRQMTTILFMMLAFALMALVLSGDPGRRLPGRAARAPGSGDRDYEDARREVRADRRPLRRAGRGVGRRLGRGIAAPLGAREQTPCPAPSPSSSTSRSPNTRAPPWVLGAQIIAGIAVPLLIAAIPIRRASRVTVRETLDQHGVSAEAIRPWTSRLPLPLRNALRRPGEAGARAGAPLGRRRDVHDGAESAAKLGDEPREDRRDAALRRRDSPARLPGGRARQGAAREHRRRSRRSKCGATARRPSLALG